MSGFSLNLKDTKCPINLVMVKKAVHEGKFSKGGIILCNEEEALQNITQYLKMKGFRCEASNCMVLVHKLP